jgi:hypothetical protein
MPARAHPKWQDDEGAELAVTLPNQPALSSSRVMANEACREIRKGHRHRVKPLQYRIKGLAHVCRFWHVEYLPNDNAICDFVTEFEVPVEGFMPKRVRGHILRIISHDLV